jgi:geranylgeranyl pyrophosphate synthase
MSDHVFVIRNQLGQFWTRVGEWVDGREPQRLLKLKHHDEAVNHLVELSSKDIDLRGEVIDCPLNERKDPVVEISEHKTPTLAEKAATEAALAAAANEDKATADTEPAVGSAV